MKKLTLILLVLTAAFSVRAQDEAIFTHTFLNPFLVNPGYTGISGYHQIQAHMNQSWTGFKNAPQSYALTWNGPVAANMGLGILLFTENAASLTRYRGQLSYGFNFLVKEDFRLGIGLSTEFHQERLSATVRDNPLLEGNDPLVEDRIQGARWFDASMGVSGDYQNRLFFGLSTTNMVRARLDDLDDDSFAQEIFNYWLAQLGYRFDLPEYDVLLEPSVFLRKARNAPFLADIAFRASFMERRLTGGLLYRAGAGGQLGLLVGTRFSNFGILYSYNVGFQRFQQYSNGTHELTLSLEFPGKAIKAKRAAEQEAAAPAAAPTTQQ